jgi:DNA mismatch endonuclease (patch repair protein)
MKAIFVHGCFWHAHDCEKGRAPKSKLNYWGPKLAANQERDTRQEKQLRELGWSIMTIWQCDLKNVDQLQQNILDFLS